MPTTHRSARLTRRTGWRALGGALLAAPALARHGHGQSRLEDVTLITDFGFNGRHSYFYLALEKGFYREAGFNVSILRGQGSADAIRRVAAGNATLGFADAGALLLARGNDQVPVKLSAIIYASPPQALFALQERGLAAPASLAGRTLADTAFSSVRLLFGAYARAAGIDPASVTWVTAESATLPSLLANGRVDAIGQFTVGQPLLEAVTAPRPLTRFAYRDVGLDFYGNGLIATENTLATRPDLVRALTAATLKGLREAIANPEEAGAIMHRAHRQVQPAVAAGETRLVGELASVPGQPLGAIDPARVASTVRVMSDAFTLRSPVAPDELFVPGLVG
ncbi:ABC transporter substrate-binding protein [Roseococcus suduntuyensis]|uniref:Thiamine pyrimidine synthase n=1 Tax=Roseococcus suduntuyensis TaxID=455361 RepID=A0A840ADS6_9PROT|nr:ABC transporter substrate-binding protein [Roseococcus suduntuyensis]MBB3899237.1 NitT/TauT family transport system substrate-binding protein [Roseococcus suduntuyensis]